MRNSLVGWFVLGIFLPVIAGGLGVLVYSVVTGLAMPPGEQIRMVLAGAALYVLIRLFTGKLSLVSRVQRRHQLFTPLYQQRPHEWASRIA